MKITEKTFNTLTGEETIIERDETSDEIKSRLESAKATQTAKAKQAARDAVLEKLGLTADEAAALLG